MTETVRLVMCPPTHFDVSYAINPWMDPADWSAHADQLYKDATEGWQRLHDTYASLGAEIFIEPPERGLPDMVFTANCAVALDGIVLLAQFRPEERRGEEEHNRRFFEGLLARGLVSKIVEMPARIYFEGAGDAVWDRTRQLFWCGHGQRSSREATEVIAETYGQKALPLRLVDPRFYHLDTCLCILPGGEILHYPPAFEAEGLALLAEVAGKQNLIAAGDADANTLAVNSFSIGNDVVFGNCSEGLEAQLAERGYKVHRAYLGSFGKSGGSAYCLTLRLNGVSGVARSESAAVERVA
jgi:N-dimethylarginine dimethylaminohydrolase